MVSSSSTAPEKVSEHSGLCFSCKKKARPAVFWSVGGSCLAKCSPSSLCLGELFHVKEQRTPFTEMLCRLKASCLFHSILISGFTLTRGVSYHQQPLKMCISGNFHRSHWHCSTAHCSILSKITYCHQDWIW